MLTKSLKKIQLLCLDAPNDIFANIAILRHEIS